MENTVQVAKTTINEDLLIKVEQRVKEGLNNNLPKGMVYHTIGHTLQVVNAAQEIGENSGLNAAELEIVTIAAWFHDVGYMEAFENHEEVSTRVATDFLQKQNYDPEKIKQVAGCIMATQMPQSPQNLLEEVLCDADLHHLGTDEYFKQARLLQEEINNLQDGVLSDKQWMKMNVQFIKNHSYFTDYAQETFEAQKKINRKRVKKKLKKKKKNRISPESHMKDIERLKKKMLKGKGPSPSRGIETMFRTTSKNHLELSSMADNKANIMISVNSIILSILLTVLFRKLDEYPHLLIPCVILTLVCLGTIVFSILATRPNISSGKFTRDNVINKETNLLFFGNFHGMKLTDYEWGMKEMLKDGDYLYTSLIRDIYFLGVVLGKKYRLLRISYTIFMFGFVLAVLAFVIAEAYFKPPVPF